MTVSPVGRGSARRFAEEHQRITKENEKLMADWRTADAARRKYNDDAIDTLRTRNAAQHRAWEQSLARVRRDNQTAAQRYQRDKQATDDHNMRAARTNILTSSVFDLQSALAPRRARPRPVPRPGPARAP